MKRSICFIVLIVSMSAAGIGAGAFAAIPLMSPDRMQKYASHVFTGEVTQIYTAVDSSSPNWKTIHCVAELRIDRIEKGKHESPLAYVRFWNRSFTGSGPAPPSHGGHRPTPNVGEKIQVFVVTAKDGGLDVMAPNGFGVPADAAKVK